MIKQNLIYFLKGLENKEPLEMKNIIAEMKKKIRSLKTNVEAISWKVEQKSKGLDCRREMRISGNQSSRSNSQPRETQKEKN